jgi:hypothetical protein
MNKLYIRQYNHWVFFDCIQRTNLSDFMVGKDNRYGMTFNKISNKSYPQDSVESCVLSSDRNSTELTSIKDYLDLAQKIKYNGLYLYNKKLGKAVLKNNG